MDLRPLAKVKPALSLTWPWLIPYKRFGQDLAAFPNVKRWHETMKARPAASRGIDVGSEFRTPGRDAVGSAEPERGPTSAF